MSSASDLGITDWKVTILPLPKRFSRGSALGFCGGFPVGVAEALRGKVVGTWWPEGKPELLTLEGTQEVRAAFARGNVIPGVWQKGEKRGAAAWRWGGDRLHGEDLHDARFEKSWATLAGGDLIVGQGVPSKAQGQRTRNVGLVWRPGEGPRAIVDPQTEVNLLCSDGVAIGGSRDGRATLWPQVDAAPIDLAPAKCPGSEVRAVVGLEQYGVAFRGMCARAARWTGSAASFADLTPAGFETARIVTACQQFQAGIVRQRDCTQNGSSGCDDQAVLWQGSAERWFNLNSLLPAPYNSSTAWAIEMVGPEIRICGEVRRCEVRDPGCKSESHYVPIAHPAVWTGRLVSP